VDTIVIWGRRPLNGCIRISGAKNGALPVMAAVLLTEGATTLCDVPELVDVATLVEILQRLGVAIERGPGKTLRMEVTDQTCTAAPFGPVQRMRASICVLGPLLARRGEARVPLPGGCVIGERPIDLHLMGLRALGAEIKCERGWIVARAGPRGRLVGARVNLLGPHGSTVLGTANIMAAATLAEGTTVIEHAAREPEIQGLARFLNKCGARIAGIGTPTLVVRGVEGLRGVQYRIIPDRVEAGTFAAAAAITGGTVRLENARPDHLTALVEIMSRMGVEFDGAGGALVVRSSGQFRPVSFSTLPYPGIPTDVQPQLTGLLSLARGESTVEERVHPGRFTHVDEMMRLGARIKRDGSRAVIRGVDRLCGAPVSASDLRAGAGLIVAALGAEGKTTVSGVEHIDRGYSRIVARLAQLGADIRRESPAAHARAG